MSKPRSYLMTVYKRLFRYVIPHWKIVPAALIGMILVASSNAYIPFLMSQVIGILEEDGRASGSLLIPLILFITFVVRGFADFMAVYGLNWLGRAVIHDLREDIFQHYTKLPSAFYDLNSSGSLVSKLTYNTEQVSEAISNVVVVGIRDSLTIIVLIGAMIYISPALTTMVAVAAPIVGWLISLMSKAFRRYGLRIQTSMGDATRVTEEALSAHRIVKVFEGQEHQKKQFSEINERNRKQFMKLVAASAAGDMLTQYTVTAAVTAMIAVAFSGLLIQDLGASVFIGFLTAMGMTLAPLKRIININAALQRGIAAGLTLFETIDEPVERDAGTKKIDRARGEIKFKDLSFGYQNSETKVLNNINLFVPAGSSLAIVGRSGAGKSTLVGLLPRFYDVDTGQVCLDGIDVREYRLKDLRRQVSLVSQDVILFDDSIANNIAYGLLADSPRADIEAAAEAAYVKEFADELPDGLDSPVGQRGALLSGGQRQRIAIARALLKNAPILILDEATSSLDTRSEKRIQSSLKELMKDRTTLVIAHRLSTVENVDRIVVLDQGITAEEGTHTELMSQEGIYSGLHRIQFSD
ncbi:MAG: lipid A export permease/ATP-binding protein MsbA [Rhodospirillaceae bacterium]|nr:lipid A export permease/ATP-binding protein MsbA [Rhodospirillaceae bacterium]